MWIPHRTTSKLPPSSCGGLWVAACVGVWHKFPNTMQKRLWRAVLAPSRAFRASRQTPQCRAEVRKFLKESPSIQSHAVCEPKSSSLFLAITASQALVDTVSVCILKQYFSALSLSVYKSRISKHLFLFFLPVLPILYFVTLKVPQSLKTLLIHTNDWPLFEAIENACTSCWEERGGGGSKDGKADCGKSIELKWNYLSVGKANSVLIESLNCFRERGEENTCALNQGYSTHTLITWEMRPVRNRQLCFGESSAAVFTNLAIYLLYSLHHSHTTDGFLFCTT